MRLDVLSDAELKIFAQLEGSGPPAGWVPGEGEDAQPSWLAGTRATARDSPQQGGPRGAGVRAPSLGRGWEEGPVGGWHVGVPWVTPSCAQPASSLQCRPGWTLLSPAYLEQRAPATTPGKVPGDHPAYQAGNGVSQPSVLQKSYLPWCLGAAPG